MLTKMFQTLVPAAALALSCPAVAQFDSLEGPYAVDFWGDTGIAEGTTEISETVELFYDVQLDSGTNGVSTRTAEYSTVADEAGLVRLYYDARFRHVTFSREFILRAFVDSSSGREIIDLVDVFDPTNPDEPNTYDGVVELDVKEGFAYGFIFGGAHFNNNPNLNGNLVIWELDGGSTDFNNEASQWSAGPIAGGTAGARPAVRFDYNVDLGSSGVTTRSTQLLNFATEDGDASFNWTWRGTHNSFQSVTRLDLIAGGQIVSTPVDTSTTNFFVFTGRQGGVPLESSNSFGARITGGNFDARSDLVGTFIVSRFAVEQAVEPEPCLADQNLDGILNGADFNAWLFNFQQGCPD